MIIWERTPFLMIQIPRWPVTEFSQTRSAWPSLLKSLATSGGVAGGESNRPNTATEFAVPTNTLPLQTMGTANLTAAPI